MAKQIKRYILILLLIFIFSTETSAQETSTEQPLSEILRTLETQFTIQFNYAEDAILKTEIVPPPKNRSLKKTLQYLESNTRFKFVLTDDNIVLVISKIAERKLQELSEVVIAGYIVKGINKLSNGSFEIDISDFDILPIKTTLGN